MTGCKMVEKPDFSFDNKLQDEHLADLVGTSHLAEIIVVTRGAIVVNLEVKGVRFKGVLLDVSNLNLSLTPAVVTLPKPQPADSGEEKPVVVVNTEDSEVPEKAETGINSSACQYRQTYLSEQEQERSYNSTLPSRSIHRLHTTRRLRHRVSRPKFFLCSMCKTHCMDSDNNSDKESSLTTPPIKISFNSPNGHSVLEIEPKRYRKSSHKRKHSKHKSKKHSKRSRDIEMDEIEPENVATAPLIEPRLAEIKEAREQTDTGDEDSECNELVIDIPGEPVSKRRRRVTPHASQSNSILGLDSPPSTTSDVSADPPPITKTKARLRRQKITSKVNKSDKVTTTPTAANKPKPTVNQPESIVSEVKSRLVSTYESANGKRISIGDVIWGKIIGFPWWPGRVCAITVDETKDGMILDHTADIDWYCSPTKSHLSCSLIYPFLEEFAKRFDKKKKSKGYTRAVNEAKCDAVLNAQYETCEQEDEDDDEEEETTSNLITAGTHTVEDKVGHTNIPSGDDKVDNSNSPANNPTASTDGSGDSGSLLVDAFLRTTEQAPPSIQIPVINPVTNESSTTVNNNNDTGDESEDCLTIALPSPQSLLNSH